MTTFWDAKLPVESLQTAKRRKQKMSSLPPPKRPKNEPLTLEEEEEEVPQKNPNLIHNNINNNNNNNSVAQEKEFIDEQEEALVALLEHRSKEVEHLRHRLTYYKSQLGEAEKRLESTKCQLARLKALDPAKGSVKSPTNDNKRIEIERTSSPVQLKEGSSLDHSHSRSQLNHEDVKSSRNFIGSERSASQIGGVSSGSQNQSKPQLFIPPVNPKAIQPFKANESDRKVPSVSGSRPGTNVSSHKSPKRVKVENVHQEPAEGQHKGTKRKLDADKKEHSELIPLIRGNSSPSTIRFQSGCLLSSQHKRKLRSLVLCPTNEQLFVTSALDGIVNLWELQGRGSNANLLSTTDCGSEKRRWPEDIAWHPEGNKIVLVYSADGGDSQISIMDLNKTKEKMRVRFLREKPHVRGIINNIEFMPWDDICFATAGSDHAVVLWTEKDEDDAWKPKTVHRNMHSSAVMGVAGMQQKQTLISVGADKRIIGFDLKAGRAEYQHQIESKCMSVLTNPCDFNLFMVQTGTPERQLRLFDIRLRKTEIHAFGWKQESSESQSALINQTWSPDGLYLTSGSADPMIHIFDIRYNARKPSQSVRAHQKRVFKAAWHHSLPLLISISSDLNIGLHKVM
ncbi:hypothetical protein Leryth_024189 [Lithospermum erythrorhizon]|nr:hypothetical protein Leryth_024189 [Lithospermum erythrorhizon]